MECSSWPVESVCLSNRQRVLKEELVLGHQLANQLGRVVSNGDFRSAEGLVTKILSSFSNSLSILNGNHESEEEEEELNISPIRANNITIAPPPSILELSSWDAHNAVESAASMDLRGSFKRRKKMTSHAWSRDSPDFNDDGHAWRKYGQKQIQNAIHPRSYFRCSHKYDQGCTATKQVQKLDHYPQLFRTTYYGNHTCTKSFLKAPDFFLDTTNATPTEVSNSKFMIIYNSNNSLTKIKQEQPLFSSTKNELIKSNHTTGNKLSSSDYLVSSGTGMVGPSEPISGLPSQIELDRKGMIDLGQRWDAYYLMKKFCLMNFGDECKRTWLL
ncbi:WRKY DNA-binding transcription factor 70-like [Rosa rugosa]|uniref:WRKY DNA-binding transcription factor 70-like n=1 Tax=Rosa rugosa TaxID=74645 RepID=UPI002B4107D7|nr:WRKY DNA-binding transcription factor 70-like [Rosa rugosa]XP_062006286.1 WRKY DNA-binding transcription factor 70-like [Rosa rugosa]XP_062006288.1 WRKY DNA-binding transcription factor 70-like [Rosa rugosa]XP_062006289.1 WRKY DNA-binding transcription factor 70-like [Rosa rugosa]XP_062006290.1 WRKY DNA-binding transcription factor 70-like [Rosa rugosa]XP_062006291.1 WRKY DNA-binding transcription factor 70-like [Rosa rugosa]XP_062006292.1 WRKY DNA-binding transcription factor 70-like [Ros